MRDSEGEIESVREIYIDYVCLCKIASVCETEGVCIRDSVEEKGSVSVSE